MEVFAFSGELPHQLAQFFQPSFGGADGQAFFTLRIGARLAGIKPVLHGSGQQAVGDVPDVSLLVGVGDAVGQVHGFAEGFAEWVVGFLHGCGSLVEEAAL